MHICQSVEQQLLDACLGIWLTHFVSLQGSYSKYQALVWCGPQQIRMETDSKVLHSTVSLFQSQILYILLLCVLKSSKPMPSPQLFFFLMWVFPPLVVSCIFLLTAKLITVLAQYVCWVLKLEVTLVLEIIIFSRYRKLPFKEILLHSEIGHGSVLFQAESSIANQLRIVYSLSGNQMF